MRTLKGRRVAVLAADGFEKVELMIPVAALKAAGAKVDVIPDPNYIGVPTPPSPLRPDVLKAVTAAIQRFHGPEMHVFPMMSTGASDGSFFRAQGIPVYDVDGSWGISPDDERAHGLDERIPVRAMYDDVLHWEMIITALTG